ncbi:biotin--[acetyl-CoA-carboxylase] ligase [Amphiplicatus metriothermophilus]|uniref:biotin--[biotin carboxyl-carrier protein] ligase n=1 Tax=Amphiplicatus metriothermophilus TaxID=1519374 RepID=A0A239PWV7_9PROT|nr:biotin--[acetyl-CoA-carboxylase] ligase [Amphiplicatus metriothermophilus]MBB5519078.1 BirA family biotin operon repressor/biotin-[acetyl-CoA-carboxylase] ligase [Amphiplicatus metriothermophilus]SNT74774.1 BirA family transcriptional regulator, biotin operon repressor / biotin-[acetyl-CoA-carboxylase] ligase [Amphiplicatus metriothermophilus]
MAGRLSSGAALEVFETLDSTNREARRRADAGARGPVWLVALEQTAGYGRRGAAWVQAPGDFAGTFLFDAGAPGERLGELSFVAGLAVLDAVESFAPRAALALKWPNDVLAAGGKLAGVLIELLAPPALVALGVGANIVSRPEAAAYPTARLLDLMGEDAPPSPQAFAAALDAALDRRRAIWRKEGFAPIRAAWLDRAARLGERIVVNLPDGSVSGVFRDLDKTGALILECADGTRTIAAGTILSGRGE